jgi:NADPH-dependent 2,4-dienoyl-CoA reductase/sulfur reductase-like enzyme/nitrite reductase/ring-hydroxylating ferredoxin subunit
MPEAEYVVAKTTDLKDGQMKPITVGNTKILLVRLDGTFYAIGSSCPHYGAPLEEGVLCGDRIVCPWHESCFNVTNGALLEPPALDDLPQFNVRISSNDLLVSVPEESPDRHTPAMVIADLEADSRTFILLGAGAAGCSAAQTLRQIGFQGRIVMIGLEGRVPYDRPSLSKEYLAGKLQADALPLRPPEFFVQHGIERLNRRVVTVAATAKSITFADGSSMRYDALLLATGGQPRTLDVPGSDLSNIFLLRTYEDADRIIEAAQPGNRVVIVGDSFIGMEAAASLTQRQLQVAVVAPGAIPFEKVFGKQIGEMLKQQHVQHGIQFHTGKVSQFEGEGKVRRVILNNGEKLDADLVIIGVGVRPATDYVQGMTLNPDGGVPVNPYLQAADGLYAAGDIAVFPDPRTGKPVRIEHWRLAEQHGRVAAHNMVGHATKFDSVPFFWTSQFDLQINYVGHADAWDEIIVDGDIAKAEFIAYYVKDNRVLAAAGCKRDQQICALHELMQRNTVPRPDDLRNGKVDLLSLSKTP